MAIGGGASLGSASGEIRLDISQAEANVRRLQGTLTQFGSTAGDSINRVATGLGLLGAARGIGNIFAGAVGSAADFEQQISAIAAVTGSTGAELDSLREKALQLGKDTSFSAKEAAFALEELAKAGVSVEDILNGAADGATALAAAGGVGIPQAATVIANALNQFGLAGDQATHVADLIAAASATSSAGVLDIGEALGYVGVAAEQAGIPIEDTITAIAALADVGITGSRAGTSLNSALSSLAAPTDKAKTALDGLGVSVYDAAGQFRPLPDLLSDIANATRGMTEEQRNAALQDIFDENGLRAINALLKTQGDEAERTDKTWKDYAANVNVSGAAADQAEKRLDNFRGSLEALKGSIETAAIMVGSLFLPALRELVDAATVLVNAFIGLPEGFQLVAAGAGLVAGAVAGIAGILVLAGPRLAEFGQALKVVRTAMLGLVAANPAVLALVGAIALFGLAYKTNFGGFGDFVDRNVRAAVDAITTFTTRMGDVYASFSNLRNFDALGAAFASLGLLIDEALGVDVSSVFYEAGKAASNMGEGLGRVARQFDRLSRVIRRFGVRAGIDELFGDIGKKILSGLGDAASALPRGIGTILAGIETGFRPLDSILANVGRGIFQLGSALEALFDGDVDAAFELTGNAIDRLGTAVETAVDTVVGTALDIGTMALSVGGWLVESAGSLAQAVYDKVVELWPDVQGFLGDAWEATIAIGSWLVTSTIALGTKVAEYVAGIWPAAQALIGNAWEAVVSIGSWLVSSTVTLGTSVKDYVASIWPGVRGFLGDAWDAAIRIGSWVVTSVATLGTAVKDYVTSIWPGVKGFLGDAWEAVVSIGSWIAEEASSGSLATSVTTKIEELLAGFNFTLNNWKLSIGTGEGFSIDFSQLSDYLTGDDVFKVDSSIATAANQFGAKAGRFISDLVVAGIKAALGLGGGGGGGSKGALEEAGQILQDYDKVTLGAVGGMFVSGLIEGLLAGMVGVLDSSVAKLDEINDAIDEKLTGWLDSIWATITGVFSGGGGMTDNRSGQALGGPMFDGASLFQPLIDALTPNLDIDMPTLPSWVTNPTELLGPVQGLIDEIVSKTDLLKSAWEALKFWEGGGDAAPSGDNPGGNNGGTGSGGSGTGGWGQGGPGRKTNFLPAAEGAAADAGQALITAMQNIQLGDPLSGPVKDAMYKVATYATEGATQFNGRLIAGFATSVQVVHGAVGVIGQTAGSLVAGFGSAASAATNSFVSGLVGGFGVAVQVTQGAMATIRAVASSLGSLSAEGFGIGQSLGQGIANGIASMIAAVAAAGAAIVNAAIIAAKAAGGIASPSRVMAERIGLPLSQGVAVGILSGQQTVNRSMSRLLGSIPSQGVSTARMLGAQPTGYAARGGGGGNTIQVFALKSDELVTLMRQAEAGHGAAVYVGDLERAFAGVLG